jgi:hypothetical protein
MSAALSSSGKSLACFGQACFGAIRGGAVCIDMRRARMRNDSGHSMHRAALDGGLITTDRALPPRRTHFASPPEHPHVTVEAQSESRSGYFRKQVISGPVFPGRGQLS